MIGDLHTPQSVLARCRELDIKSISLRVTGLGGVWHECIMPVTELREESFEDGIPLTATRELSGEPGAAADVRLLPEPETAFVDPFSSVPTLSLICGVLDPVTGEERTTDSRSIARRAQAAVASTGLVDQALIGFEAEYFVFESVRFQTTSQHTFVSINGGAPDHRYGQSPTVSMATQENLRDTYARWSLTPDQATSFRDASLRTLQSCGLPIRMTQVGDGDADHHSIIVKPLDLVRAADAIMLAKYVIKGTARRFGRVATFMPKPLGDQPGSGLTTMLDLLRGEESVLSGNGPAGLSDSGLHVVGGLLQHAPALLGLTSPSTNSFRRLHALHPAPRFCHFHHQDLTAAVRVPNHKAEPGRKPIEFRPADASCNPYLALSAIVLAALDGLQQRLDPASDTDALLPSSLAEALTALEANQAFLTRSEVFTEPALASWIAHKREAELPVVRSQPHPQEFALYFDV